MDKDPAESTGIMISTALRYGYEYIAVSPMKRRQGESWPSNPSTSWLFDSDPLDGLCLHGWMSESYPELHSAGPVYRGVQEINQRRAEIMAKMLARVNRAIEKADAREHGDVFMVFAKSIGATWVARTAEKDARYSSYRDVAWRFESLNWGRDEYRRQIAAMVAAHPKNPANQGRAA